MIKRPSDVQMYWLDLLAGHHSIGLDDGAYCNFAREDRIFDALANKGLVTWREPGPLGHGGYVLTDAGVETVAKYSKFGPSRLLAGGIYKSSQSG